MRIDILMATYNGGKYIANQLYSLQMQTHSDWRLWVRDDGSTDNTVSIIQRFAYVDSRINLIIEGSGNMLGPGKNFMGLIQNADSKYVLFCDQDDVWFEKKIELMVLYAESTFKHNMPCLVYSDGYLYQDSDGDILLHRMSNPYAANINDLLFMNAGYHGCTMLFNSHLSDLLKNYKADYFYMHDDVVTLLAYILGKVYYLPKVLMLYRQHNSNVTDKIAFGVIDKIRRWFNLNTFVLSHNHYKEKKSFFDAYCSVMDIADYKLFEAYLSFPNKGYLSRIYLIIRHRFSIGGYRVRLIIKAMIRSPISS